MSDLDKRLIERAVELWCRALRSPTSDVGDASLEGLISEGAAHERAAQDAPADLEAAIERFRVILLDRISEDTAAGGASMLWLLSDYGPEGGLAEVADQAGVSRGLFPLKSRTTIRSNHVISRFGYVGRELHYPLSGGRWLICGEAIGNLPDVIHLAEGGRLPAYN